MNRSIPTNASVEFLNLSSLNPLISRCEIKVLYTGKNRNRSFITKDVANQMAGTLPGTPIIGQYLYDAGDYGDHGEEDLVIDENGLRFVKDTVPYGFIAPNAKTWWQNFLDKDGVEREYLVTEGFLWTGRYPECQRIIESGNGQSMELHRKTLKGEWSKIENDEHEHFIISEAFFEGLCILGEDVEPCFEGASISRDANLVYSLNKDDFKDKMSSFMTDLKEALVNFNLEGGKEMSLPNENPVIETPVVETPVVETPETVETPVVEEPVVETPVVEEDFAKKKKKDEEDKDNSDDDSKDDSNDDSDKDDSNDKDDSKDDSNDSDDEDEKKKKKKKNFAKEEDEEDEEPKKKYSLEEVVEYQELLVKFNELQGQFDTISNELNGIKPEYNKLKDLQIAADNKAKDDMIGSFYMLSDEDKAEVIENKANFSLEEIEAKLSVICVRNKVNFALDDTSETEDNTETPITTFNVGDTYDATPSWLKAVDRIAKNRK